ncbi:MAG TPA: hypothetical protein PKV66_00120 [Candidatus Pelethenecus sp.]|nr:hypothetical protein [Candidatus Pelethenecus sp.]
MLELTFGCEALYEDNRVKFVGVATSAITNHKNFVVAYESGHTETQSLDFIKEYFEILGHPPQLSDLLYTIGKVDNSGRLFKLYPNGYMTWGEFQTESGNYDMTKSLRENLESEELCDFIHQLICK